MTIKYFLQSTKKQSSINVRISIKAGKLLKRKTGLSIDYSNWSEKTGFPKQTNSENKKLTIVLKELETFLTNGVNESYAKGENLNGEWFST